MNAERVDLSQAVCFRVHRWSLYYTIARGRWKWEIESCVGVDVCWRGSPLPGCGIDILLYYVQMQVQHVLFRSY